MDTRMDSNEDKDTCSSCPINRCNGFVPLDRLLVFIDMYRICSGARDGINIYFDFKNIWAQI